VHSAGVVLPVRLSLRKSTSSCDRDSRRPRDVLLPCRDDAAVELDFAFRIKRSLAITPRAVFRG
jgi:hypothetical protein